LTLPPAAERRLIALLSVGAFGSAASLRVTDAQLPALAQTFGVGLAGAAQVITVFSVAYGLLQLFYGPAGDRYGKWQVITWAVLGAGLASALCALAPGFGALLAARALAGGLCAAIIPLAMAWIGDAVAYERRQPVLARFLTGQIMGMALGQWAGGVAADLDRWRLPFVFLAIWFAVAGALLWRSRTAAAALAPAATARGHPLEETLYVLRQPWARVVLAIVFAEGMVLFGPLAFLATHLHLQRGLSLADAGAVVTLYAAGGLIFAFSAGRLVRRLGEAGLARGGGLLIAVGLLLVALVPMGWSAPLACLLAGLGFYMLHNTLQINATQMAPQARGAAVSLFASLFFLGQTAGVALAAALIQMLGSAAVIAGGGVASLAVGLLFGRLRGRQRAPAALRS
jgi:predicted MFS family arabinose efflux permease